MYLDIKVAGKKTEFSTGVSIAPCNWNSKKELVNGASSSASEYNKALQQLKDKAVSFYTRADKQQIPLTAESIKKTFLVVKRSR